MGDCHALALQKVPSGVQRDGNCPNLKWSNMFTLG